MSYFSGSEVWLEVGSFGTCYAASSKKNALELIATEPGSKEEAQTYAKLFRKPYQSCLGSVVELRAPHSFVRGAIAEGLFKKEIPLPLELKLTAPEPAAVRNLSGAARCYVASHAERAREIIANTRPGTRGEHDAIVAIMPEFQKCVPEGANFDAAVTLIRFRLAEALYRTGAGASAKAENK
jgi:hypothetical protein